MRTLSELGISPAPWEVLNWRIFPNKIGVSAKGGWVVADVQVSQYGCCDTLGDRNARLVAAAPDLYSALLDCFTYMSKNCCDEIAVFVTEKAKAALAKAGGEEVDHD